MLVTRIIVAIILLPIGLAGIVLGGWAYLLLVAVILGLAAWEYAQLFTAAGLQPARLLVIGGILLLVIGRHWNGFASTDWIISLLVLLCLTWHLIAYERGRQQAGTDFAASLTVIFYIGWIGAYLISLRQLELGMWWVLLVLPATWFADTGAYFMGTRFGKHKLSPLLSPKKTWEGYIGGILWGVAGGALLAWLWQLLGADPATMTIGRGLVVGLVMSIFPTLGDLGESMIKRQVGVKDSGHLLPGHGGFFDRIDSWLWTAVLGYYLVFWLWS